MKQINIRRRTQLHERCGAVLTVANLRRLLSALLAFFPVFFPVCLPVVANAQSSDISATDYLSDDPIIDFAPDSCPTGIELVTPADGVTLRQDNSAVVLANVSWDKPTDGEFYARVEAMRGVDSILIADGDLRDGIDPSRLRTTWSLSSVAPGNYVLSITLNRGDCAPVSVMSQVTISSPAAGAITYPSPIPMPTFTSTPSPAPTLFPTPVPTTFPTGYPTSTATATPTAIPTATPPPKPKCACEGMKVFAANEDAAGKPMVTRVYCWPKNPVGSKFETFIRNYPQCEEVKPPPVGTCAADTIPFTCKLGPGAPFAGVLKIEDALAWGFEIQATLSADTTDPKLCETGQMLRVTSYVNGRLSTNNVASMTPVAGQYDLAGTKFDVVTSPDRYPTRGSMPLTTYGADSYTEVDGAVLRRDGKLISWYDIPYAPITKKVTSSVSRDLDFVSFVRGPDGTCWCRIGLNHSWNNRTGWSSAQGRVAKDLGGSKCTFVPGKK